MKKSIFQILFLAIVLFYVLNACNIETPKEEKTSVTDMLIDSLVLKQDTIKPVVVDSLKVK